jgi:hypothetical protein
MLPMFCAAQLKFEFQVETVFMNERTIKMTILDNTLSVSYFGLV